MKVSGNGIKKEIIENENMMIILQNNNEKKAIARYSLGWMSISACCNLTFKPGKNFDNLFPNPRKGLDICFAVVNGKITNGILFFIFN